jgi:hypothetical protein
VSVLDKLGRVIKEGDYILHAHRVGKASVMLQYAVVTSVWHSLNATNPRVTIQGVYERKDGGFTLMDKKILNDPLAVVVIPKEDVHEDIVEVMVDARIRERLDSEAAG